MSHRKNACGKRPGRSLTAAAFFAPFLLALVVWLLVPGEGLAQVGTNDPLGLLQQRGGLGLYGGLNNGVVDTTSQTLQPQLLQPQALLPVRLPTSRLEQILSTRAGVRLAQFGYDQLGVARSVLVPETGAVEVSFTIPVPSTD